MEESQFINTVLILLLSFLPNYTGSLIGCKLGRLISLSHPILKFIYIVLMVFSCFIITDSKDAHPLKLLWNSIIVVFIFNLFNRQKQYSLIASLVLLILILFVNKLKQYIENQPEKKQQLQIVKKVEYGFIILLSMILLVGFVLYFIEKQNEFGPKFDYITFVFGNEKCANN
jgi:Ni,Fe-hydrogenase I cytochrome b subunit